MSAELAELIQKRVSSSGQPHQPYLGNPRIRERTPAPNQTTCSQREPLGIAAKFMARQGNNSHSLSSRVYDPIINVWSNLLTSALPEPKWYSTVGCVVTFGVGCW